MAFAADAVYGEVIAAKPGARYDAEWGNLFQNPGNFIALVYQGV